MLIVNIILNSSNSDVIKLTKRNAYVKASSIMIWQIYIE